MSGRLSRRQFTRLTAVTAASLAAPAVIAQTREKVSFAVGAGAFYFTLHYVAEAGGYYRDSGLELDSVNVSSGPRQTAAVMGGSTDVAPLAGCNSSCRRSNAPATLSRSAPATTSCRCRSCCPLRRSPAPAALGNCCYSPGRTRTSAASLKRY
jgi:hypothetical protein